jgi:hypothetical protein
MYMFIIKKYKLALNKIIVLVFMDIRFGMWNKGKYAPFTIS